MPKSVKDFLNQRNVIIAIRIIGLFFTILAWLKLLPFPQEWYQSFTAFLLIECLFIEMTFYKIDFKNLKPSFRIALISLLVVLLAVSIYFQLT